MIEVFTGGAIHVLSEQASVTVSLILGSCTKLWQLSCFKTICIDMKLEARSRKERFENDWVSRLKKCNIRQANTKSVLLRRKARRPFDHSPPTALDILISQPQEPENPQHQPPNRECGSCFLEFRSHSVHRAMIVWSQSKKINMP